MKSAKVENGLVVNVAEGIAEGYIVCGDDVNIGFEYDEQDEAFYPPATPTPDAEDVKRECLRRILLALGAPNYQGAIEDQTNMQNELLRLIVKENDTPNLWDPTTDGVRKTAILNSFQTIENLRAKSKELQSAPPQDYTNDIHWA